MLRRVRVLFVLLMFVVMAAGAVHAVPRMGPKPASESGTVLDRLLGWLSTLFQAEDNHIRVIWEAEGSHWDPNGIH